MEEKKADIIIIENNNSTGKSIKELNNRIQKERNNVKNKVENTKNLIDNIFDLIDTFSKYFD